MMVLLSQPQMSVMMTMIIFDILNEMMYTKILEFMPQFVHS